MKTTSFSFVLGLSFLVCFGAGCATALRGTHREVRVVSNVQNTEFTVTRQGQDGVQKKSGLERKFDITSGNRKPFSVSALTPGGQHEQQIIEWTPKGWIPMAGGGLGFATVFGVGGLVSVGVDGITGAYSDPKKNEVIFCFDASKEIRPVTPIQKMVQQPSPPCPPIHRLPIIPKKPEQPTLPLSKPAPCPCCTPKLPDEHNHPLPKPAPCPCCTSKLIQQHNHPFSRPVPSPWYTPEERPDLWSRPTGDLPVIK